MSNLIPRPEHPRPDFMRPLWLNLNGTWQFDFDDANVGVTQGWNLPGKTLGQEIIVPFCFQCEASGLNLGEEKHEIMWYRRSFTVPAEMAGKRLLLRFGAVDFECQVYVNGKMVGGHKGGYTPFALDVTDYVIDGENDLCLRVEDRYDCTQPRGKQHWKDKWFGCWYTPTSGIWQTVYLEAAGDTYLKTVHVTPDIDLGQAHIRLTLDKKPTAPIKAEVTVSFEGKPVCVMSQLLTQRSVRMTADLIDGDEIIAVKLWSPGKPNLYDVSIKLDSGDEVETYFGMRKVELKDGHILLNNGPLYQRLILDQGYWPESLITPPSDDAIKADIEWTKKFGFNGARKHQKLEDPRYYYWADKLGLLVWGEVPSAYEFTQESCNNLSETLAGYIERDFNHPSIITWLLLNESWGATRIYEDKRMQALGCMLYHQAKALDNTRLVSTNDGCEELHTDIYGLHDYAAWGEDLAAHFADPDKVAKITNDHRMAWAHGYEPDGQEAFLLTEFGGIAIDAEGSQEGAWGYHDKVTDEESFFKRYQSVIDAARAIPYCQGYCYTQLTDVAQEINGLLTYDRKVKVNPERVAAITRNPDHRNR